jgi:hypothetical protein
VKYQRKEGIPGKTGFLGIFGRGAEAARVGIGWESRTKSNGARVF